MHIHGNSLAVIAADIYSAAQAERAAAAQQAAEVRKKLLRRSSETGSAAPPEETLFIGQWIDPRHSRIASENQLHPNDS
jgi:septal ring factor EnvC (AmiA/AmiB activator)